MKKTLLTSLLLALIAPAAQNPPSIPGYRVTRLPANIAPTATVPSADPVFVEGRPRQSAGHPNTLWDRDDIERLRKLLTSSRTLQGHFAALKRDTDRRIAAPLGVPDAGSEPPTSAEYHVHAANAGVISDLGALYALSGEAKYGEYCRKMILAYADRFPSYPHPAGWTPRRYRSAVDGRLTGQFLEDGEWLIAVARGFDLVYNLPSFTPADRAHIRDDLFKALVSEFYLYPNERPPEGCYINGTHNRAVICTAATLMAGYASDDQAMVETALYGVGGARDQPTGGVFGAHFSDRCIATDGLWHEGAMGYQFMALGALLDDAEVLWHHGMDLYRYRNGVLKRLFDSPLQLAYPDATTPSTHDTVRSSLRDSFLDDSTQAYEYAYLRYRDPRYLACVTPGKRSLHLTVHKGPPAILYDIEIDEKARAVPLAVENVNFTDVGYGILRGPGNSSLLLEYGPSRSHGHPDKLAVDLYALGDVVMPDPGMIFPYNTPLQTLWYTTTVGHCALTVDEKSQIYAGNRWRFPKTLPEPAAQQLVYGPAETMGIQRAASDSVYPGVTQDRAVFLSADYLADIFGAFSAAPHKYDLAWHIRGDFSSDLPLAPMKFPDPVENGYVAMTNVRHATSYGAWSATVTRSGRPVRLFAAPGAGTEVIAGGGFYRLLKGGDEPTPAILERRVAASTLYGNVLDISGRETAHVRSVAQEGGLDAGFGLLSITTGRGTDLCFASYRPGHYHAGGLETDALQAFVLRDGTSVQAMYLAGGTQLKAAGAALERDQPGLAYLEKLPAGDYIVGNPSQSAATLRVTLPNFAFVPPADRGVAYRQTGPNSFTVSLPPSAKLRLSPRR